MKLYQFQRYRDRHRPFSGWAQGLVIGLAVQSAFLQPAIAQVADLDLQHPRSHLHFKTDLIAEQPPDMAQETTKPQVIKCRLNDLSGVSEWIRAKVTGNQVKLLHTVLLHTVLLHTVVAQSGLSKGFIAVVNLPISIAHTWYDHPTSRIAFRPDDCALSACLVTGADTITLPAGTTIYQGRFTLEYTESGWVRTVTFKLPDQNPASAKP
jgi:hypothetical protein